MGKSCRYQISWARWKEARYFWPVCVYERYSDATSHRHDVHLLRQIKPALEREDRLIYFFGVHPQHSALLMRSSSSKHTNQVIGTCGLEFPPNELFRIVPKDCVELVAWPQVADFEQLCRDFGLEEVYPNAMRNPTLKRAMDQAQAVFDASCEEEIIRLFTSALDRKLAASETVIELSAGDDSSANEADVEVDPRDELTCLSQDVESIHEEEIEVEEPAQRKAQEPKDKQQKQQSEQPHTKTCQASKGQESNIDQIFENFWPILKQQGWEEMIWMSGETFYKMPNTSFFECIPNVRMFDSKEKAVRKWLNEQPLDEKDTDGKQLTSIWASVWPLLKKAGWSVMIHPKEEWYCMPGISFDKFLPNVTIFNSKLNVLRKFLESTLPEELQPKHEIDVKQESATAETRKTVQTLRKEEVKSSPKKPQPVKKTHRRSVDVFEFNDSQDEDTRKDRNEISQERVTRSAKKMATIKRTLAKTPNKTALKPKAGLKRTPSTHDKPKHTPKPKVNVIKKEIQKSLKVAEESEIAKPVFVMKRGILEKELKERGWNWIWRNSLFDSYWYLAPGVDTKKPKTFVDGVNCFKGYDALVKHIKMTKLYYEIEKELVAEHEAILEEKLDASIRRHQAKVTPKKYTITKSEGDTCSSTSSGPEVSDNDNENEDDNNESPVTVSKPIVKKNLPSTTVTSTKNSERLAGRSARATKPSNTDDTPGSGVRRTRGSTQPQAEIVTKAKPQVEEQALQSPERMAVVEHLPFGVILDVLQARGWKCTHHAQFGYVYLSPEYNAKTNAEVGKTFFPCEASLEEYLEDTGLRRQIEEEVALEELSSPSPSPEIARAKLSMINRKKNTSVKKQLDMKISDQEEKELAKCQKEREAESASDSNSDSENDIVMEEAASADKRRNEFETPTPIQKKRKLTDGSDINETSDADDKNDNPATAPQPKSSSATTISPESTAIASSPQRQGLPPIARKIADSFTPSPDAIKQSKQHQQQRLSTKEAIEEEKDVSDVSGSLSSSAEDVSDEEPTKKRKLTHTKRAKETAITALDLAKQSIDRLVCAFQSTQFRHRDEEKRQIEEFLKTAITGEDDSIDCTGNLYVTGAPGCGKSACLNAIEAGFSKLHSLDKEVRFVQLNAMGFSSINKLCTALANALLTPKLQQQLDVETRGALEVLEEYFLSKSDKSSTVLVLDEMDFLLKGHAMEKEFCRLFQIAQQSKGAFVFIGIANSVDLTERYLPQFKAQNCEPKVIVFQPYSHQTIEKILIDRLGKRYEEVVNAHGITFLARKVASTNGDIRLALDICRRILQQKLSGLGPNQPWTPVSLTEMLRSIKTAMESKGAQIVKSLPRNLQMILFAFTQLMPVSGSTLRDPAQVLPVSQVYESYVALTRKAGVFQPLNMREFRGALEVLSSEGVVGVGELKQNLFKLVITNSELAQSFRNDAFFSRL